MLRIPPIIAPRFLWGDRTILACELYQTLFGTGAYTESDKALRGREVWSRDTKANLQFHSNNFSLKQLSTNIKTFHYYGTGV